MSVASEAEWLLPCVSVVIEAEGRVDNQAEWTRQLAQFLVSCAPPVITTCVHLLPLVLLYYSILQLC